MAGGSIPWSSDTLKPARGVCRAFTRLFALNPATDSGTRDLFTEEEFDVMERSASQTLKVNDVVFGQLVRVDEIVMVESCSPFGLPPGDKIPILDLRDGILSAARLALMEAVREYDIELRGLYLSMSERFLEPWLPELQNTDGESLVPQRVIFDIDSPRRAFDALKHLAAEESEADPLAAAEQGPNGELLRADIPWTTSGNARHRSWKNTLLGRIRIESNRLTCEVNSVERAETIRQIMKESLGEQARYRATEIQSIERMMTEGATGASQSSSSRADQHAALMSRPEIRAHLDAMLAAHYEDWVTEKISALGDQTPLGAVQSPGGRKRVEALVLGIERSSAAMPTPPDPAIFRQLRERLGLMESEWLSRLDRADALVRPITWTSLPPRARGLVARLIGNGLPARRRRTRPTSGLPTAHAKTCLPSRARWMRGRFAMPAPSCIRDALPTPGGVPPLPREGTSKT